MKSTFVSIVFFALTSVLQSQQYKVNYIPNEASIATHPKASPSLRLLMDSFGKQFVFQNGSKELFVHGSYMEDMGLFQAFLADYATNYHVYARTFTAQMPANHITKLLQNSQVVFVDIASKFNAPKSLDDKSLEKSNVFLAQSVNNPPLLGKEVVLGIVDVGFQTTHPTFYSADGKRYRVKRFWQQKYKNQLGPAPFNYGILKNSQEEILAAKDQDGSHGTHVAGIAGGSGFTSLNNKLAGVAPECDLVFVGIKYSNDTISGSALGDYVVANATILDGFDYVFRYADSNDKPAVCNLSWGMHTGPHDGTSLFDLSLEDILNTPNPKTNKVHSRAVVGANGNSAQHEMHVKMVLNGDSAATLAMDRSRTNYSNENVYVDLWSEPNSVIQMNIALIDSFDNSIVQTGYFNFHRDTFISLVLSNNTDTLRLLLSSDANYPHNNKSNNLIMLETNTNKRFFKISFKGTGTVHGWNSGRTYDWTAGTFRNYIRGLKPSHWINGDANNTMVENGGTSKAILSVGSYNNRVNWVNFEGKFQSDSAVEEGEISGFSSWGNTLDDRLKPDISAPGQFIANAYHKDAVPGWLSPYILEKSNYNTEDVYWALLSGTSMASPHAAGILALLMDVTKGRFDYSFYYELLKNTAKKDAFTGSQPNSQYGTGKIDAYAAVLQAKNAARNSVELPKLKVYVNKNKELVISELVKKENNEYRLFLYDASGRLIMDNTTNEQKVDISYIPTGVYLLQLQTGSTRFSQTVWID